jgi:hypothetical protein
MANISIPVVTIYFNGTATDVSDSVVQCNIRRGRSRELDAFTSGVCTFTLLNEDRRFDPLYKDGPYFGQIRPRLRVSVVSEGISLFDGFIEDWNFDYSVNGESRAEVSCIDGLALLSQTALLSYTNTEDTPAERIQAILARDEVSYSGDVYLDPGFNPMQADTVADNTNTLNYLQLVQDTDLGRLFVDGAGVLRYRDRTSGIVESARVIFADANDDYVQALALLSEATLWFDASSPEPLRLDDDAVAQTILQDATLWFDASEPEYVAPVVSFHGVQIEYGSEFLYTRAQVTRVNGETQTAVNESAQDVYGIRTLNKTGLLFLSDAETASFTDYLVDLYGTPNVRVAAHELILEGLSGLHQRYIKRLEIGDVVRTVWTPNDTGDAIDTDSIIEGVEHQITPATHRIRLQLTPFSRAGFILDDPNRGLLDTSELTY